MIVIALVAVTVGVFNYQRFERERRTAAEAAPGTGRFVNAGDVKMYVQESGPAAAPVVILVHGTGTWSEIWRETIDALSADHRVIAVDLPPFGYSEKPLDAAAYTRQKQAARLVHVLDALRIKRATIVGHSVGARPVVEAALMAPDRISRMILVDPALGFAAKTADPPQFDQNKPGWLPRTIFSTPALRTSIISSYGTNPMFLKQMFSSFVSIKSSVTPQRLNVIQQPMVVEDTTAAYGAWLSMLTTAHDDSQSTDFSNFRKLQMPVSIIWGSTDTVTPLWQGRKLNALIPKSKLIVIDGVGHIPYIEDPPRFLAALRQSMAN